MNEFFNTIKKIIVLVLVILTSNINHNIVDQIIYVKLLYMDF